MFQKEIKKNDEKPAKCDDLTWHLPSCSQASVVWQMVTMWMLGVVKDGLGYFEGVCP